MRRRLEFASRLSFDKKPRTDIVRNHNKSERQQTQRQGFVPVTLREAIPAARRKVVYGRPATSRSRIRRSAFS